MGSTTEETYTMTGEVDATLAAIDSDVAGIVKVHGLTADSTGEDVYGLHIAGSVSGLEADISDGAIHIHEGGSWDDFGSPITSGTTYDSDSDGTATLNIYYFDLDFDEVEGKTIIVHNTDGTAVACGVLMSETTSTSTSTTEETYTMTGEVDATLAAIDSDVAGIVKVHGLTADSTGEDVYGLHIAG